MPDQDEEEQRMMYEQDLIAIIGSLIEDYGYTEDQIADLTADAVRQAMN